MTQSDQAPSKWGKAEGEAVLGGAGAVFTAIIIFYY